MQKTPYTEGFDYFFAHYGDEPKCPYHLTALEAIDWFDGWKMAEQLDKADYISQDEPSCG